ncbi:hypothetical protein N0Y54_34480 [Nostoc punctiforme UO1]|uniref:hypothetical protein n=1 Tax=Nostoc punctiforme TaxID=272131 RepID=UPI0030978DD7
MPQCFNRVLLAFCQPPLSRCRDKSINRLTGDRSWTVSRAEIEAKNKALESCKSQRQS